MRYDAAEQVRTEEGYDLLVTAHTADDQLESFFVDIITGASIYTLGGINPDYQRMSRPMLDVSTAMVNEYLGAEGITPVFDSTNAEKAYVRNRVRLDVIPVLEAFGRNYISSVSRLQQESAMLDEWLAELTSHVVSKATEGGLIVDRKAFEALATVPRTYLLGKTVSGLCRGGKAHIAEIEKGLAADGSKRISLPGKWVCEINPLNMRFFSAEQIEPFSVVKEAGADRATVLGRMLTFSGEQIRQSLVLRSRREGDRFKGKKLKKVLWDMKLDLYERDRVVIVEKDGVIIDIRTVEWKQ
jgi:tRNA(Ile)-lysidine synthase